MATRKISKPVNEAYLKRLKDAAYMRKWRKKNPEKVRAVNERYYAEHKEELNAYYSSEEYRSRRRPREKSWRQTLKGRYSLMRAKARIRSISCTLSFEEYCGLVEGKLCSYCDGPLAVSGSGLDRIDNNLGYIPGNVRPCCKICNQAKSDTTEKAFREWIIKVYEKFVKK